MIESAVHAHKISCTGFFQHIYFRDEMTRSTYKKLSGFKPNLKFSAVFIRMIGKCPAHFFRQQWNIRFLFTRLYWPL